MSYNKLYERFVGQGSNTIQGYIAYGLYKNAKREWVTDFKSNNNGNSPSAAQIDAFVSAITPQIITTFETQAASALVEFADGAVAEQKPEILKQALRGNFWKSVFTSLIGGVAYTLILILLVFILSICGVDILNIFQKLQSAPT